MVREIRLARVRTGLMLSGSYEYTKETNFHIEVQGQDQAEVHIPMASLSAAIRANPEGTFKPEVRAIVLWDDSFTNPIRWAGPIVTVTPTWEKSELVIGAQGISYTLARIPAISTDDRAGNNDVNRKWIVSGTSYQQLVNHIIASSTSETSDGIKLPQSFGDLNWTAGDLSKTIPLVNPPTSVWDVIDSIRTSPAGVETVFVPQLTDSTHIGWVPVVATKANPHYRKDTSLGTVDLSDSTRGTKGFNYTNDSGQRSASWFFGSSNASVKGNDNYTDLTGSWVAAPSGDVEFMHTFSGETYDSELSSTELNTQISARTQDSGTDYKNYELAVFDETFQYTNHLGKSLVTTDSGRMNGLSESIRITAVDWNISDPSTVAITVLPKNLTIFPRVPRHDGDDKDTKNPGKSGPGTTGTTPKTPSSKPEITTPSPLLAGTKGQPYTASIMATGSPSPTFALKTGDTMPAGLTLSKTGQITGTPSYQSDATGNSFTVVATNKNGTDSKLFVLVVNASTAGPVVPSNWGSNGGASIGASGSLSMSGAAYGDSFFQKGKNIYTLSNNSYFLDTSNLATTSWPGLAVHSWTFTAAPTVTLNGLLSTLPGATLKTIYDRITDSTVSGKSKQAMRMLFTPWAAGGYFYILIACTVSYGNSVSFSSSNAYGNVYGERHTTALFRAAMSSDSVISSTWSEIPAPVVGTGNRLFAYSYQVATHGPNRSYVTLAGGLELKNWDGPVSGALPTDFVGLPAFSWQHATINCADSLPSWTGSGVAAPFQPESNQTGSPFSLLSVYVDDNGYIYESLGASSYAGYYVSSPPAGTPPTKRNINGVSVYRTDGTQAALSGWTKILEAAESGSYAGPSDSESAKLGIVNGVLIRSGRTLASDPQPKEGFWKVDTRASSLIGVNEAPPVGGDAAYLAKSSNDRQVAYSTVIPYAANTNYTYSAKLLINGSNNENAPYVFSNAVSTSFPHKTMNNGYGAANSSRWVVIGDCFIAVKGSAQSTACSYVKWVIGSN